MRGVRGSSQELWPFSLSLCDSGNVCTRGSRACIHHWDSTPPGRHPWGKYYQNLSHLLGIWRCCCHSDLAVLRFRCAQGPKKKVFVFLIQCPLCFLRQGLLLNQFGLTSWPASPKYPAFTAPVLGLQECCLDSLWVLSAKFRFSCLCGRHFTN